MTVAFLGTKGGTGTTTMTVNVGAELRRLTGWSTVLVDLKPAPGDVALFLGLRPRHTLVHVLDQRAWTDESCLDGCLSPHACGVTVLAAGEEWGRPAARDVDGVESTIAALGGVHDAVVIDAGSMLTPATIAALEGADAVVLVANPDVPCLRNLQRLIDALRLEGIPGDRLRILLNRASDFGVVSVAQISGVLGVPIDWTVPSDYRTVAASLTSGIPVRALRGGAVDLLRHLEAVARSLAESSPSSPAWVRAASVAPRDDSGASQ